MDVQKFVRDLTNTRPSLEKVISYSGLDEEEAKSICENWNCERKKGAYVKFENPIEELIYNYHVLYLHIGNIIFNKEIKKIDWGFLFAFYPECDLGFLSESEEVVWYDQEWEYLVLPCAKSAEAFMELILLYSKQMAEEWDDTAYSESDDKILLEKVIEIAGGSRYEKFLRMLFQINPPT